MLLEMKYMIRSPWPWHGWGQDSHEDYKLNLKIFTTTDT